MLFCPLFISLPALAVLSVLTILALLISNHPTIRYHYHPLLLLLRALVM
jgi:hypothetical protein